MAIPETHTDVITRANIDTKIGIPAKEESQSFLLETKDLKGNTHKIMAVYAFIIEPPTEQENC